MIKMESPRTLTAVIRVRFNYKEEEEKKKEEASASEGELELINHILEQASQLSPEHQELLAKFAEYLNGLVRGGEEQSPN